MRSLTTRPATFLAHRREDRPAITSDSSSGKDLLRKWVISENENERVTTRLANSASAPGCVDRPHDQTLRGNPYLKTMESEKMRSRMGVEGEIETAHPTFV